MTRTRALTLSLILQLCMLAGLGALLLAGLGALLLVAQAHAAPADACEPSLTAEPAPLACIYLPAVMQLMPGMSAESTPWSPTPTPEPDVELPLGDASQ